MFILFYLCVVWELDNWVVFDKNVWNIFKLSEISGFFYYLKELFWLEMFWIELMGFV